MKKTILILALILCLFSCSNDDGNNCQAERDEINQYYDQQIEYVMNHPGPNGIDYRQIEILNQERQRRLDQACN
jgi:hypothetical protein